MARCWPPTAPDRLPGRRMPLSCARSGGLAEVLRLLCGRAILCLAAPLPFPTGVIHQRSLCTHCKKTVSSFTYAKKGGGVLSSTVNGALSPACEPRRRLACSSAQRRRARDVLVQMPSQSCMRTGPRVRAKRPPRIAGRSGTGLARLVGGGRHAVRLRAGGGCKGFVPVRKSPAAACAGQGHLETGHAGARGKLAAARRPLTAVLKVILNEVAKWQKSDANVMLKVFRNIFKDQVRVCACVCVLGGSRKGDTQEAHSRRRLAHCACAAHRVPGAHTQAQEQAQPRPRAANPTLTYRPQVRKTVVPDYNEWVKPEDEMWVEKIRGRLSKHAYSTAAEFMSDLDQIRVNAEAYNSPGRGRFAALQVPPIAANMVLFAQVGGVCVCVCACVRVCACVCVRL